MEKIPEVATSPKENTHFYPTIRTRSESVNYYQQCVMLRSEEQALNENSKSNFHSIAMFASSNSKQGVNHSQA